MARSTANGQLPTQSSLRYAVEPAETVVIPYYQNESLPHENHHDNNELRTLMLPFNRILFGTYETIVNRCVEINSDSINLFVPSSNSPSGSVATTQFQIAYKHVKRIECTNADVLSVLYISVTDHCAKRIRECLEIVGSVDTACIANPALLFFDVNSPCSAHRYISLHLNQRKDTSHIVRFDQFRRFISSIIDEQQQPSNAEQRPSIDSIFYLLTATDEKERKCALTSHRCMIRQQQQQQRVLVHQPMSTRSDGQQYSIVRGKATIRGGIGRSRYLAASGNQINYSGNSESYITPDGGSTIYVTTISPQTTTRNVNVKMIPTQQRRTSVMMSDFTRQRITVMPALQPMNSSVDISRLIRAPIKRSVTKSPISLVDIDIDTEQQSSPSKSIKSDILVNYPEGERGAITIHISDLDCLANAQFLNDTIIDFYLRYIVVDLIPAERRNKVHVFNSFFWNRLTSKSANLNGKAGQGAVRSWTKDVNIFDKDFLLIPINEDAHWFLAIIVSPINAFRCVDVSADGLPTASIIVLDSLQSTKHYKTTCIIKNYLINEWTDKGNQLEDTTIIDRALFRGIYPKNVPQQDNYWDCGVFVLQYAELFLTQPPSSISNVIDFNKCWSTFSIETKRQDIRNIIQRLSGDRWSIVAQSFDNYSTTIKAENNESIAESSNSNLPSLQSPIDCSSSHIESSIVVEEQLPDASNQPKSIIADIGIII